ncbi:unnamed protein product [Orchesella dallaii]|uniref:Ionotropic glutamate receptor C-terminal domain-containing protein n=1 Tax=Orchesella dallaii TaxID=48710 RepID=A0ABP1QAF2_9HEXA
MFLLLTNQPKIEVPYSLMNAAQLKLPALKLIIRILAKSNYVSLVCGGYCGGRSKPLAFEKATVDIHKSIFWNAQGARVNAIIYIPVIDYFTVHSKDLYICAKLVGNKSKYCNRDLMSVIELSYLHNTSFNVISRANRTQARKVDRTNNGNQLIYCNYPGNHHWSWSASAFHLDYHLWTSAFPFEFWLLLIILIFTSFCTSVWLNSFGKPQLTTVLFQLVAILIGQEASGRNTVFQRKTFTIIVSLLGMIFCALYENVITSCVTAPLPAKAYENLKELLDGGYKILWFSHYSSLPYGAFERDFVTLGIPHKINSSFHEVPGTNVSIRRKSRYLSKKFAIIDDSRTADTSRIGIQMTIKKEVLTDKSIDLQCHKVKKKSRPRLLHWEIYTMNRHWLIKSLQRLEDSGLPARWDEWANWNFRINGNESMWEVVPTLQPDIIELKKFLPIIVILTSSSSLAVVTFSVEYAYNYYLSAANLYRVR